MFVTFDVASIRLALLILSVKDIPLIHHCFKYCLSFDFSGPCVASVFQWCSFFTLFFEDFKVFCPGILKVICKLTLSLYGFLTYQAYNINTLSDLQRNMIKDFADLGLVKLQQVALVCGRKCWSSQLIINILLYQFPIWYMHTSSGQERELVYTYQISYQSFSELDWVIITERGMLVVRWSPNLDLKKKRST